MKKYYNYLDSYGYAVATAELLEDSELNSFIRRNENLLDDADLSYANGQIDGPYDTENEAVQAANDQDEHTRQKYSR